MSFKFGIEVQLTSSCLHGLNHRSQVHGVALLWACYEEVKSYPLFQCLSSDQAEEVVFSSVREDLLFFRGIVVLWIVP